MSFDGLYLPDALIARYSLSKNSVSLHNVFLPLLYTRSDDLQWITLSRCIKAQRNKEAYYQWLDNRYTNMLWPAVLSFNSFVFNILYLTFKILMMMLTVKISEILFIYYSDNFEIYDSL